MRTSKRSSLIHLIYFSRAQLSADPAARLRQINEIARHAQKKNEFSVITSLLIVDQGYFIQILEGERMSVQDTFQRISADSRHRDVHIVEWREIAKREFVTSFAYVLRTPTNDALFQKANLAPMLQRGTPKSSTIHALARLSRPTRWPSRVSTICSSKCRRSPRRPVMKPNPLADPDERSTPDPDRRRPGQTRPPGDRVDEPASASRRSRA